MLLQRALSVVLVLLGVALGLLLPRPWAEVSEAEAAKARTIYCLVVAGGETVFFNTSNKAVELTTSARLGDGTITKPEPRVIEPLGLLAVDMTFQGAQVLIASQVPPTVLVDAVSFNEVEAGGSPHQAACYAGAKAVN